MAKRSSEKFKIERLLGKGGMGEVFLAREGHREVALKFLQSPLDPNTRHYFKSEVRLLSKLSHPNLVKIFDFFEAGKDFTDAPAQTPFFVMEYISGVSLDQLPSETSADQWVDILAQICHGLHYLHARNILHRDLKPSNIFFDEQGKIKILDFSLSTQTDTSRPTDSPMGTLFFLAPECFGESFDVRSDLFALGVLLYRVLAGNLPFSRPLLPSFLKSSPTPLDLHSLRPDLPEFFCDLIHRLIRLDPDQRPGSALTLLRYLKEHASLPIEILPEEQTETTLQKVPMVGRQEELQGFQEILKKPGFHPILLKGPTGVGRSRFLEELKWHYLLQGCLFETIPPPRSTEELFERFKAVPPSAKNSFWIFTDLHLWSDILLKNLPYLLNRISKQTSHLTVVLELNSDLVTDDHPLFSFEEFADFFHELRLHDLSPEASRQLINEATPGISLTPEIREEIIKTSGGRPLLILQGLNAFLMEKGSTAGPPSALALPKNLQEATQRRIQKLATRAQRLLALILTHPEEVFPSWLEGVWGGEMGDYEGALLELIQQQFLSPPRPEEKTLRLAHPSLRETLLQNLESKFLQEGHRQWIQFWKGPQAEKISVEQKNLLLLEHAIAGGDIALQRELAIAGIETLHAQGAHARLLEISDQLLPIIVKPWDRCQIYAFQAPTYLSLGRYSESLKAYQNWFELREDDDSLLQKTKFHLYSGLVYFNWGKREEALSQLNRCLQLNDPKKYPALRPYHARANHLIAALYEKSAEWDLAIASLERSLRLDLEDPVLLGESEQRLGKVELRRLNYDAAYPHFEKCLKHYEASGEKPLLAIAHNLLALLLREQGGLSKALEHMKKSFALVTPSEDRVQWARNQGNLGLILLEMGNYRSALEAFQESVEVLRFLGNEEDRLISEIHLATAYMMLGNFDRLNQFLQNILKKEAQYKRLGLWTSAQLIWAEGAYLIGEDERAATLFHQIRDATEFKKDHEYLQALLGLGRLGADHETLLQKPTDLEALQLLPKLNGPLARAWGATLSFLKKDPTTLTEEDFSKILKTVRPLENPETRLEMLSLLGRQLKKNGLSVLAKIVFEEMTQEWEDIYKQLPEECKMDYEKNRPLKDLDAELSQPLNPRRPAAAAPIPPASAAPPTTSGQISEGKFRQFCEISRQVSQKTDPEEILERVMDAAIELSHAERGFIILKTDPDQEEAAEDLEIKTARHLNHRALQKEEFQFSRNLVQQAMEQGTPLVTENALEDSRFHEMASIHQMKLKSVLVVPLELEGKILGALYLDNRYRPDCFTTEDITLISGFAGQAALALQKARMVTALKSAKEKLESRVQDQEERIESLSTELTQARKGLVLDYKEIIGKSPAMVRVFQLLDHVTQTKIPVWIWGESGTGKELIARALHFNSNRKTAPLVSENCSSIPETLIESELFGHKKGAFTHADRDRIGLFEQANGGTLFLDEIADMSLNMQAKLLRVLQESEIRPVGSNKKIKIDVRLVTASHRDIEQMVQEGKFRQDLFYRLNGMTIPLPPLRARKEDIPLLVHHLVNKISKEFELKPAEISQDVIQYLMEQPWPGNIRQLEAMVRNLLLFAHGKPITRQVLAMQLGTLQRPTIQIAPPTPTGTDSGSEEEMEERRKLLDSIMKHNLDKSKVAEEFSITLKSVYARMERLGIPTKKSLLEKYLTGKVQ